MSDKHKRPGTITFVAIMLFVFGAGAVISSAGNGIYAAFMLMDPQEFDPNAKLDSMDAMDNVRFLAHEIPGFAPTVIAVAVVDVLFAVALLVCAVGLLRLRPTARTMTMTLILLRLVYSVAYDTFSALVVLPAQIRFYDLHPPALPNDGVNIDIAAIMKWTLYGVFGCGLFMHFFVAGLIVLLLRTEKVKGAFAGTWEPAQDDRISPARPLYSGYEDEEGAPA